MIQHSFSLNDQIGFAKLSGDYNPIHIDPVKARRTLFGEPILHGLHVLLWALEKLVAQKSVSLKLVSLKTYFNHSIILGKKIQLILKSEDETSAEIQLLSGKKQAIRIMVSFSLSENKDFLSFSDSNPSPQKCRERNPEHLTHTSGSLNLCLNVNCKKK